MVLKYDPKYCLPSAAELPDSDDTPVDNELQNLIPNLLEGILAMIWPDRIDWFLGVNMGVYYAPDKPAIVPDGFLSLGVERFIGEEGRLSYVLWEEDNIAPVMALEVISKTYGGEYERKKAIYAELGIQYYVIYRPNQKVRQQRQRLEVYEYKEGRYEMLGGNPVWLPKIGLGLGRDRGTYLGREREWLYWYDAQGNRLLTPEEKAQQATDKAQKEETRANKLADKLKELGIDPNTVA